MGVPQQWTMATTDSLQKSSINFTVVSPDMAMSKSVNVEMTFRFNCIVLQLLRR